MKEKDLGDIKSGFKVPDAYFENFERRMIDKVVSVEETAAPLPETNPFTVPDGYFTQFEERLFDKLKDEPQEPKVIPLFRRKAFSYVASVAAVLLVIITSTVLNKNNKATFGDLDAIAVENYLLETLELANPEEALLLDENDEIFATSMDTQINREAVIEYFKENVDEPAILLNED